MLPVAHDTDRLGISSVIAVPNVLVHGTLTDGVHCKNTFTVPVFIGSLDTTAPTFSSRSYFDFASAIDPANSWFYRVR